jgi:hypothetical protein
MQFSAKLVDIELSVEREKSNGAGSFVAHVLTLKGDKGFQEIVLPVKGPVARKTEKLLKTLKKDDTVTIVKEKDAADKYWNVTDILKGAQEAANEPKSAGSSSYSKSKGTNYDKQGAIKGNAVTNGVQIAIAMEDTSEDNIVEQTLKVLRVHARIEKGEEPKKEEAQEQHEDDDHEAF